MDKEKIKGFIDELEKIEKRLDSMADQIEELRIVEEQAAQSTNGVKPHINLMCAIIAADDAEDAVELVAAQLRKSIDLKVNKDDIQEQEKGSSNPEG